MVGWRKRNGAGISGGRFRLTEKGDPVEGPDRCKDKAVSSVQRTYARAQEGDHLDQRGRETLDPESLS